MKDPEDMSRDELVKRVEALEELIELRGVDDPDKAGLNDIFIAGQPVGAILNKVSIASRQNARALEKHTASDDLVGGSGDK